MSVDLIGWLALRIVFAWMFLYPVKALTSDWEGTVRTTALLFPAQPRLFAAGSLAVMIGGALSILFGVWGRLGALGLLAFSLGGAVIHYRLAAQVQRLTLSDGANAGDRDVAGQLVALGTVGHVSSAQKNFVLAAVALFFLLVGTGPASID